MHNVINALKDLNLGFTNSILTWNIVFLVLSQVGGIRRMIYQKISLSSHLVKPQIFSKKCNLAP